MRFFYPLAAWLLFLLQEVRHGVLLLPFEGVFEELIGRMRTNVWRVFFSRLCAKLMDLFLLRITVNAQKMIMSNIADVVVHIIVYNSDRVSTATFSCILEWIARPDLPAIMVGNCRDKAWSLWGRNLFCLHRCVAHRRGEIVGSFKSRLIHKLLY
jgi:hypothetical protein